MSRLISIFLSAFCSLFLELLLLGGGTSLLDPLIFLSPISTFFCSICWRKISSFLASQYLYWVLNFCYHIFQMPRAPFCFLFLLIASCSCFMSAFFHPPPAQGKFLDREFHYPPVWMWYACQKSFDHTCSGLFLGSPLVYMSVFMPVPHYFDYCSFVVSSEIEKCESSRFVLFQDCFGYSRSLDISYEF